MATSMNAGNPGNLTLKAYTGDGNVLLAMNLRQTPGPEFAGFAIKRIAPSGKAEYIGNRLNFQTVITKATEPEERVWTPSDQAPFAKFRWVDFPPEIEAGDYTYEVSAMNRDAGTGALTPFASASITLPLAAETFGKFDFGFTRGYLSSQAYADKFDNAPIRPAGAKTMHYDTAPFLSQYEWLGFNARRLLFDFLAEAASPGNSLDVFAYDLDEPDIISALIAMQDRLRAFLDNAPLHTGAGAVEPKAYQALLKSAGRDKVKQGHFKRFAHDKIFILKRNGQAVKVLTGSANFSVRGLYVQANNVLVFDHPDIANLYLHAFEQAFNDPSASQAGFAKSPVAANWFRVKAPDTPDFDVAFSPHKTDEVSLDAVIEAMKNAKSSIMFAIMALEGSGAVLDFIRGLDKTKLFCYGVSQQSNALSIFKPGSSTGQAVPFSFLKSKVPEPFKAEWSGGAGQVVHHKFIVIDFNGDKPMVFTGSSNLAAGGEMANGDNLLAIRDRGVAAAYAVEAVRLLDHYQFRAKWNAAPGEGPLRLSTDKVNGAYWWAPYYDPQNIKCRDRLIFSGQQ